jgi:hypothetical protein
LFIGRKILASFQEDSKWIPIAMREPQIRTALEQHGSASAAGDLDAERDIYQENAVCEYRIG